MQDYLGQVLFNASQLSFAAVPLLTYPLLKIIFFPPRSPSPRFVLFFTANHTCNELFWTEDDNQNTEIRIHDSREQIRNEILKNTTAEMERQKWTNCRGESGQTAGGARSALATT